MKKIFLILSAGLVFNVCAMEKLLTEQQLRSSGKPAIIIAAALGDEDEVDRLANADTLDTKDNEGKTALHYAIQYNRWMVFLDLLEDGAERDAADNLGRTPLMYAVMYNNKHAVENLLRLGGAAINARDNAGRTALQYAIDSHNKDIQALLQKYGAIR